MAVGVFPNEQEETVVVEMKDKCFRDADVLVPVSTNGKSQTAETTSGRTTKEVRAISPIVDDGPLPALFGALVSVRVLREPGDETERRNRLDRRRGRGGHRQIWIRWTPIA